jgi:hypothetical protein
MVVETIPVSRRIIKPSNCALALGIPTSEDGFRQSGEHRRAGFAAGFRGGWNQYRARFVADFERVEPYLRKWGVTILPDVTLASFSRLLDGSFDAAILFSHWDNDEVEFREGFEPVAAIAEAVPPEFSGIIDLCVCHPLALVRELQCHRPRCLVKFVRTTAAPDVWLYFYRVLFSQLQKRELPYLEAVEEVVCGFLDSCLADVGRPC